MFRVCLGRAKEETSLKLLISWSFRPVRRVIKETIDILLNSCNSSYNNNNNNTKA